MTALFEFILRITFPLQYGRVDRRQLQVILGAIKVQETEAVKVGLIGGGLGDAVDGGLDVVAGEEREGVAGIDSEGRVEGLGLYISTAMVARWTGCGRGLTHFQSPVTWSLICRAAIGWRKRRVMVPRSVCPRDHLYVSWGIESHK